MESKRLQKSHSAEKNPSEKTRGGDPMLSMIWTPTKKMAQDQRYKMLEMILAIY